MKYSIYSVIFFGMLFSCKKDTRPLENPPVDEAEEVITTVKLILTDSAGVLPTQLFAFKDLDGPGGNFPQIDSIILNQNNTYFGSVLFLNESVFPADTISNEVLEEAVDHLICYIASGWNGVVTRTDWDGTNEIGLQTKWKTFGPSTGKLTLSLKHQPGIKNGSCTIGDTDVEITFDIKTQ